MDKIELLLNCWNGVWNKQQLLSNLMIYLLRYNLRKQNMI